MIRTKSPSFPASRIAAAFLLCLAALPARAEEYWENALSLADGRFPALFSTGAGPLQIWQESQSSGDAGKAFVRFARFADGAWKGGSVSDEAYSYTTSGSPPILFSASQARDGTVAVAIAASGTEIEVWLSRAGTSAFKKAGVLRTDLTSVAPRIYPSASGGWLIFVTQGRPSATNSGSAASSGSAANSGPAAAGGAAADAGAASATDAAAASLLPSSVSIYVANSPDGATWGGIQPLVAESESLLINFLPYSAPFGSKDIVVFQTYILGEGDLSSRYALMSKTSSDGGASWTAAKPLTNFPDPAGGTEAGPEFYDNQGAQLVQAGGKLYVAWERRKSKTAQTQVWAARLGDTGALDPKSAGPVLAVSGAFKLTQLVSLRGAPAVLALEDKLKSNRSFLAALKDGSWVAEDEDLPGRSSGFGSGMVAFARLAEAGGRLFLSWQWQADTGDRSRILALSPDTSAAPPVFTPLNFALGKRSRAIEAQLRVNLPDDPSGIKGYAYIWKKTPDKADAAALAASAPSLAELWRSGEKRPPELVSLTLPADRDGQWTLWASDEDNAGNRSPLASVSFYRKAVPPPAPILIPPDSDQLGFLSSNSFTVRWIPPEGEEIAGYTWDLSYASPLEAAALPVSANAPPAKAPARAPSRRPGLSAFESSLLDALGLRLPPPSILGTAASYSASNVDNGYYVFSVSAIDTTGNISGVASILLKANKYVPYTAVTLVDAKRDDVGRTVLRILGKGFLADGRIERAVLDRDGRAPYDVDRLFAKGEFSLASDRQIDGITFEGVEAGNYRIGLFHSTRGWFWTSPMVAITSAGTVKYGVSSAYEPSFSLFSGRSHPFTIYDAMVLMAILFGAAGILLFSRQVVAVAREGEGVRLEALALVTGGPMPKAEIGRAAQAIRRRGTGLRAKFTVIIALLVIFVILLLSVALGYQMVHRTSYDLARGLDLRARVLLESVAQGGRYWLGQQDQVTQLGVFTAQAKAMEGADYITITGAGQDPKVATGEVVYATGDDKILDKLDPSTLNSQKQLALGSSVMRTDGGPDLLAPLVQAKARELQAQASSAIANELELKVRLNQEMKGLKSDAAGKQRRDEIVAQLESADASIRATLSSISDSAIGSLPPFDPANIAATGSSYLYFKPILEYKPSDSTLYRGMVRLEVNTRQIAADVSAATILLLQRTLLLAAIALAAGIIGAFVLSTVIVVPIRKLVAQIERIRDTEDKADLEGSRIEVKSRDELFTLASTVNEMTSGLVSAAKASKELTVGKGIQKMFIPLSTAPGSSAAKLSTGRIDEELFEVFGYYEGAKGVSGDYWDFRAINTRYHYFIKCDISGKGVSAALIMVEVATMVINYFGRWSLLFPSNIDITPLVYQINNFIYEMKYKGRFAAFTLGVFDAKAGVAYLCDAGDAKLHVWSGRARELLTEGLPNSPAAGPFDSSLVEMKGPYTQVARALEPGDVLMLYTDGIEEAKRSLRDQDAREMTCVQLVEPSTAFASFLSGYFADEKFALASIPDPAGSGLFSQTSAEFFADSFATQLSLGLAEISTDKLAAAVRDKAIAAVSDAVVAELERAIEAGARRGGWKAEDAAVVAVAAGPKAAAALRRSLDEAISGIEAKARAAYISPPSPSFLADSLRPRMEQTLASLDGRLLEELGKTLEKRHHELDKDRTTALLRESVSAMAASALAAALPRLGDKLAAAFASIPEDGYELKPAQAHLQAFLRMPKAELASTLERAVPGPCAPKAVAEISRVASAEKNMKRFVDRLVMSSVYHDHHEVGTDSEEFGHDRIADLLKSVDSRSAYVLARDHDPLPPGSLSFDFSKCEGSLEEKVMALIAVEKVFRIWKDASTTERDQIVIDEKVDDFLASHFDQYRLYFSDRRPYYDPEKNNPGYRIYAGLKEDEQYDDLTILAIRRK
jgi:hypothetical protein